MPDTDPQQPSESGPAVADTNTSLLEDASVLLMFHNAAVTNNDTHHPPQQNIPSSVPLSATVQQHSQPHPSLQPKPIKISTVKPSSPTLSDSPKVSITQKEKDAENTASNSSTRITTPRITPPKINNMASPGPAIAALAESTGEKGGEGNQKAIVAAAALAAAAGIPLPLTNKLDQEKFNGSLRGSIDELLRTRPQEQKTVDAIVSAVERVNEEAKADYPADEQENGTNTKEKEQEEEVKPRAEPVEDVDMNDVDDETAAEETQDEKPEPQQASKQPVKRGRKPKRKPSGKDYTVDMDSGIISCICSYDHDDGFTIQCDVCNRWQHGVCMGISDPDNAPDDYSCSVCHPRPVDVKRAQRLQEEAFSALKRGRNPAVHTNKEKNEKDIVSNGDKENSGSNQSTTSKPKTKPKPTPPTNPYGKNLEENDIEVLDPKQAHLTQYFPLKTYDYQDHAVYKYVESQSQLNKSSIQQLSKSDYEGLTFPKLKVRPYSDVNSKKFNGISKLGLFTESSLSENDLISDYLGEINFKDRYIQDSRNHYRIWGVEKPNVAFVPSTPLVIDARFSGNSTRFIRRSCHPNADIKPINVDGVIKFVVFAKKSIKPNSELTLGWNWDSNHSIHGIIEGNTFDQTPDADKPSLILSIESILTFVECACVSNTDCALAKVKRASSHIYRSSRKNQTTSGLKYLQSEPAYTSIQQRLLDRELSNIRDSSNQKQHVSILSSTQSNQEDVGIRPYIYNYLTNNNNNNNTTVSVVMKKRKIEDNETKLDYLPIPLPLATKLNVKVDGISSIAGVAIKPPQTVKKLSFADYKKKKNPTA
jgi:hypothetical protein